MADSLKDAVRADAFRKLEVQDELADPFATPERNRQHADSFFSDEDEGPNALGRPERNFMERNLDGDFGLMAEGGAMKHVSESVLDDQQESVGPGADTLAEGGAMKHVSESVLDDQQESVGPGADKSVFLSAEAGAGGSSMLSAGAGAGGSSLLSASTNEFLASDEDGDPGADALKRPADGDPGADALKRPAACIPKAKPKAKGPRPLKRPAACVSTSPDDEADAVLKKPAAGPHVAAAAPPAPAASPLPGCGGVTDTWEWVAVEGQQHLRECVIGDWKAMQDQTILS